MSRLHKQHIVCKSDQVRQALINMPAHELILQDCTLNYANLRPLITVLGKDNLKPVLQSLTKMDFSQNALFNDKCLGLILPLMMQT